jgi:uncharacterized membrane protein YdjX (TVP38/TMEM64 family)
MSLPFTLSQWSSYCQQFIWQSEWDGLIPRSTATCHVIIKWSYNFIESLMISCLTATFCMTFGAIFAFLLSRYIFRGLLRRRLIKWFPSFALYDHAIKTEGALFVFLMQFSLIPYSLLCYLFGGITQVSLFSFFIGVLGMALPNLFWSYLGSLIRNLTDLQ